VIGIDTNILLRIFETEDDPAQSLRARKAIEDNAPVYLHDVVLAEFVWTCRSAFKQSRGAIHRRLQAIADSTEFVVARPEVFERAVHAYGSQKSDFADWFVGLSNLDQGLEYTLTFDKGAARRRAFGIVAP
jgi:predicted nucleic-acid-binding protein